MEEKKDIIKTFESLTNFGQKELTFSVPGKEKSHVVKIGTLWQGDIIDVEKKIANQLMFPNDSITREEIRPLETVMQCILSIDGHEFVSDDPAEEEIKKAQLRDILTKTNAKIILFIYQKYLELTTESYNEITKAVDDLKKSSGSSQKDGRKEKKPNLK